MKAEAFDKKFDDGEQDMLDDLDLSTLKRPDKNQKMVKVDFPTWIVESLDKEANRL